MTLSNTFRRILLPTVSDEYRQSQDKYRNMSNDILNEKRAYLAKIEAMLEGVKRTKLRILEQENQDEQKVISALCESIEQCNILNAHRKEVAENITSYEHLVLCQTTLDMTGFHNLQDWAKAMSYRYSSLTTNLIGLSLAGAAIVYATIFGAVRGNIGLMVFTFPLFSIGFMVPALIQIGLTWAADSSRATPFASQPSWRIVIGIFMAFATIAVGGAITILNITVFQLRKGSETVTDSISRVAGVVAFTSSGLLIVIFLCSMILSLIARGFKVVFLGTARAKQHQGQQLSDFDHQGMLCSPRKNQGT